MLAKKIFYNPLIKTAIFILAVVLLTCILVESIVTISQLKYPETIINTKFIESSELSSEIMNEISDAIRPLVKYRNEEYINSGNTVPTGTNYNNHIQELFQEFLQKLEEKDSDKYHNLSYSDKQQLFFKEYATQIKEIESNVKKEHITYLNSAIEYFKSLENFYIRLYTEGQVFENRPNLNEEFVKKHPVYLYYKGSDIITNLKISRYDLQHYKYTYQLNDNDELYIAVDQKFLDKKLVKWNEDRQKAIVYQRKVIWKSILFLVSIIYLFLVSGKRFYDDKVHLNLYDRIFLEIQLFAISFVFAGITNMVYLGTDIYSNTELVVLYACIGTILALVLSTILSITKHVKNKSFLDFLFVYFVFSRTIRLIKMIINSFPIGLKMLPTPKNAHNLKNIVNGIKQVKDGELDYVIKTKGEGIYAELAHDINNISHGLKASIDNELKSERLKTELITNVSHDIRTPLTSIITYIDLLKKEGLDSENSHKYIEVLENKALRLKNLTDDLFEASKASTGNIPVELETIDLVSLVNQGMGELEDKIEASGLDFRLNCKKERIMVSADGRLLWRVIENLMSNTFKYAMHNSRVYIDINENKQTVELVMKNVSKYELNVDATELMERFTRGEESRTSEGSGLGLNIAKSLIELQHGKFNIEVDGDLFKAIIVILKAPDTTDVNNLNLDED